MQPTEPTQPQWQAVTRPLTGAEWAAMGRRYLRAITHGIPRDIWASIMDTTHNTRAFLRQPPRWFLIAAAIFTVLAIAFCSISLRNYLLYYAH